MKGSGVVEAQRNSLMLARGAVREEEAADPPSWRRKLRGERAQPGAVWSSEVCWRV
jgi:hypothetical protein